MTPEKLEQARAALAQFEAEHPLAREDAETFAKAWLLDARRVSEIELGQVFRGGGELQWERLSEAVRAFVIQSPEFEAWVFSHLDDSLLPAKKRDAQLKRLQKAVKEAETAILRAELEGKRREAEAKLAALDHGAD